jgi:aspartyl-tRNA(Asn)/glutamyl-tRNA(Gln) amidotransferase subunit B
MASEELKKQYNVTIGIECHVQLKTKTKLFSGADNDAREAAPNTLVNHIDFGLPGALPVLNAEAVPLASKAAFALGTEPQRYSKFDRKHYFYPDLPMGYQITQFDEPIILGGQIEFMVNGKPKIVSITRAHLEADAGKSTHPAGADYSFVDLNRAGTPLLEIVSEPDMHSAAEAKAYARELYLRMKYADVSEANLYYGNMRFDVNVSVSKSGDMGTRTETKNLNSFRSVEKAVEYEVNRQIDVLESGDKVIQETRGWDDNALKTFSQRTKEDAHDYRYFPDPDLPPVTITDEFITQIKADMPELPNDYRAKFKGIGLTTEVVEDIVAIPESAMTVSRILAKSNAEHARRVAFWLMQPASDDVDSESTDSKATDEALIGLSEMVSANKLSSTAAKQVLTELLANGGNPEEIADSKNLIQESDEGAIAEIVAKVIADNPKAAEDVKNGEMKAVGFLTGQVMKLSQGKANPSMAQELIKKQLGL